MKMAKKLRNIVDWIENQIKSYSGSSNPLSISVRSSHYPASPLTFVEKLAFNSLKTFPIVSKKFWLK